MERLAPPRGIELAQQALHSAETLYPLWRPWPLAVLARLLIRTGDLSAAEAVIGEGCAALQPNRLQFLGPTLVALADGELALARQDSAGVLTRMDELIARLEATQRRPYLPEALALRAHALMAQEQVEAARDVLARARLEAERLGARRSLWPILLASSKIEDRTGRFAEAEALRARAREIVSSIAEHTGSPELRASFLGQPHVPALLAP